MIYRPSFSDASKEIDKLSDHLHYYEYGFYIDCYILYPQYINPDRLYNCYEI